MKWTSEQAHFLKKMKPTPYQANTQVSGQISTQVSKFLNLIQFFKKKALLRPSACLIRFY